ncbi:MAG: hypothetical protein H7329_14125 [Opitutaceae bacterium]|nr:hypothetical protein [Cytophagales bacterium]
MRPNFMKLFLLVMLLNTSNLLGQGITTESDAKKYLSSNTEKDLIEGFYSVVSSAKNNNYTARNATHSYRVLILKDPSKSDFYKLFQIDEISGKLTEYLSVIKKISDKKYMQINSDKSTLIFSFLGDSFNLSFSSNEGALGNTYFDQNYEKL